MLWPKNLKIKRKINLAQYTSFKIGGPAQFFLLAQSLKELQVALLNAKKLKLKVRILGAGSNILVSDSGVKGLVIKLSGNDFKFIYNKGTDLILGSALKLNQVIEFAKRKSLTGLEFLIGIPGTLGGALAGNAGAWGRSIGELIKEVTVIDYCGRLKILSKEQLKFAYRQSNLDKYIIISAKLKLQKAEQKRISAQIKQFLLKRSKSQSNRLPNAGCVFKNPVKTSAGRLIDGCGLKGTKMGAALVSDLHANFILNSGRAKCSQVLSLMKLMQRKVKAKFKINLKPEIKIWR
ncbi:MAG: UDP-N-acetylmuramate dehydrogenase [Candidatus Omnitrophota bacterium]